MAKLLQSKAGKPGPPRTSASTSGHSTSTPTNTAADTKEEAVVEKQDAESREGSLLEGSDEETVMMSGEEEEGHLSDEDPFVTSS